MYACSAVIAFFALFLLFLREKKLLHFHMFVAFFLLKLHSVLFGQLDDRAFKVYFYFTL
jgi:hypothetical protein